MRRLLFLFPLACLLLAGCFSHDDAWVAVNQAFAPYGAHVVDCAQRIVDRESGHNPYAKNGQYRGLFQLHGGFTGSINQAAADRGEYPDFLNPFQNSLAARNAFAYYGSFRVNWAQTVPGDCP